MIFKLINRSLNGCFLLVLAAVVVNCGSPSVTAIDDNPAPRIVIEGYLYPGQPAGILLTKNFPLREETTISRFELLVDDALVTLTEIFDGTQEALSFNPETFLYEGTRVIEFGKSYRLNIRANIDGHNLQVSSITNVPEAGFDIVESESTLGPLAYRERNADDELRFFEIAFTRSPGVDFYVIFVTPLDASIERYIFDNPFYDHDTSDVHFYFEELTHWVEWGQNLPTAPDVEPVISRQTILWQGLPFTGRYRAVVFAADANFKDFFLTHSLVQEPDGNFHEPKFHINGSGIGVFGSAIADTVYFEIAK